MSYRVSSRTCGAVTSSISWWKRPFLWLAAWLQVRREAAIIEALRDQEREYYMLGGLVLVREMREIRMREMDDLRAREMEGESVFESQANNFLPPLPVPGPGRERLG